MANVETPKALPIYSETELAEVLTWEQLKALLSLAIRNPEHGYTSSYSRLVAKWVANRNPKLNIKPKQLVLIELPEPQATEEV